MLIFFNRNELHTLKMICLFMFDMANEQQDADLYTDAEWFRDKIKHAMKQYGKVVDDDMNDDEI